MTIRRSLILLLAVVAVATAGGAVAEPAAAAQAPCWKRLLNDWLDGRIDRSYRASCYREALRRLPEDVEAYSDARDDITRALASALRDKGTKRLKDTDVVAPSRPTSGPATTPEPAETDDGGVAGTTSGPDDEEPAPATPVDGGGDDGGGVLEAVEPANADSIPVPLLILAGLALLLLAAAASGYVARRVQARRARVLPQPPAE